MLLFQWYNEYGEFNDDYESQLDTMSPEDMTPVKPKTTYHEYLDIYNYVVRHLIPKNEMLDALDYNKSKKTLETLRDKILPGVEEQKAIASFFSINKGIETKDWDEYNWIEKQNKKINKMYLDRELKDAVKFDFVLFTKNENYRNEQIKQFENIKTTFNVLDVITKVDHFWEMLKTVGLNRDLINTAAIFKFERKIEKEVLNKSEVLTPADTKSISNKDWRVLANYTRDVVTLNWFMRQPDLTISIPEGWEYYIANLSNSRIPKKSKKINEYNLADPAELWTKGEWTWSSFKDLLATAKKLSSFHSLIFIHGEKGVGKTSIAKQIHLENINKDEPFLKINCITDSSLLTEKIFTCGEGTVYLNEVACLSVDLQERLLDVIRTNNYNVRVIVSCSVDLEQLVQEGKFIRELYYMLTSVIFRFAGNAVTFPSLSRKLRKI